MRGCRVLTRPSRISGAPVKSPTSRTGTPAAASERAVPPVDRISSPAADSPRASSTTPVLSDTEISAREIFATLRSATARFYHTRAARREGGLTLKRIVRRDAQPRGARGGRSGQAGAPAQIADLGLRQIAPAAHRQSLERQPAQT